MKRNYFTLKQLIFMAICCDIGIIIKKLISPFANIITDNLHIPGGIGTAVSISFVVIAAVIVNRFGAAMIMSLVQCFVSVSLGGVGSMGAYSPIAYFIPGLVIDVVIFVFHRLRIGRSFKCVVSNALAGVASCITANILVFGLKGYALALYCSIGAISGTISGIFAMYVISRIKKVAPKEVPEEIKNTDKKSFRNKIFLLIGVLLIMSTVITFSVLHNSTRLVKEDGALQIIYMGKETSVSIDELGKEEVEGSIKNGKGESIPIDSMGISLESLLEKYKYDEVTAVADDEYTATIKADECDHAYIIVCDDQSLKLVVFGDENSKRAARNLIRLELHQ